MAKGNKGRGNRYELECRKLFRDLGFKECETSRYASRKLDDAKVDLTDTGPFNVQCKHYEKTRVKYWEVLEEMPDDHKYNVIFHKLKGRRQYVILTKDDFVEILEMLIKNKII